MGVLYNNFKRVYLQEVVRFGDSREGFTRDACRIGMTMNARRRHLSTVARVFFHRLTTYFALFGENGSIVTLRSSYVILAPMSARWAVNEDVSRVIMRFYSIQAVATCATFFNVFASRAVSNRYQYPYDCIGIARRNMGIMGLTVCRYIQVIVFYGLPLQAAVWGIIAAYRYRHPWNRQRKWRSVSVSFRRCVGCDL